MSSHCLHNNNKLFVIPEWRMVIVRLGLDEKDLKITDETLGEFLRLVGEAFQRPTRGERVDDRAAPNARPP